MPFYSPKSPKMWSKTTPKCLVGTEEIDLGTTSATSSRVLSLKDTFTVPQEALFGLIWRPIGPHVLPLQAVETSLLGQFLWAKHNAQFLWRGALFTTYWSEHNLVLIPIVHHAVAKVTEHPSHFTADVPAFKAHRYKIQQHTYKCEQKYAQRINRQQRQARPSVFDHSTH